MAENSKIEWCHHTWSPHRGCCKISPGCALCYAEALSKRNPAVLGEWGPSGRRAINKDWATPLRWDRKAAKLGTRFRVFPSLCDWLEDRPDLEATRARFLSLIAATPNLDWLLLTKRPENFVPLMESIASGVSDAAPIARDWLDEKPPANVWFGVSVENQEYADRRIPIMGMIPAALRWVSYEPALGPVDFRRLKPRYLHGEDRHDSLAPSHRDGLGRVDWIVVGGESSQGGKKARPFDVAWARSAVEQCRDSGVPAFVKQLGSSPYDSAARVSIDGPDSHAVAIDLRDSHGGDWDEWPADLRIRELPQTEEVAA